MRSHIGGSTRNMEHIFPRLSGTKHRVTSPRDGVYNCIAWAAEEQHRWWTPDGKPHDLERYWPPGASRGSQLRCIVEAYQTIGYRICLSDSLEPGFQKVALYCLHGDWTHATRQLPSGLWTSKLGRFVDIEHEHPDDLSGDLYGSVFCYMKRSTVR